MCQWGLLPVAHANGPNLNERPLGWSIGICRRPGLAAGHGLGSGPRSPRPYCPNFAASGSVAGWQPGLCFGGAEHSAPLSLGGTGSWQARTVGRARGRRAPGSESGPGRGPCWQSRGSPSLLGRWRGFGSSEAAGHHSHAQPSTAAGLLVRCSAPLLPRRFLCSLRAPYPECLGGPFRVYSA
jgi:hypothetical protein